MDKQETHRRRSWKLYNKSQCQPKLTPEQTIEWLQGMNELMFEVYAHNPHWREMWDRCHAEAGSINPSTEKY